jgi:hemolysin III
MSNNTLYMSSLYSFGEEVANAVTHGIGALLSIAALVIMVAFAVLVGDAWLVTSVSIYGATLILLYTSSTLYHATAVPAAKNVLQKIDHATIFLLIAGTYTPFLLVNLRGPWGWTLFGLVWGIALFGVIFEIGWTHKSRKISLALYLGMGWIILIAIGPMLEKVAPGGLVLLLLGGLSYTLGVVFYVRTSMAYHHAIWHLFVLLGSALHFFSIFFYVIPDISLA